MQGAATGAGRYNMRTVTLRIRPSQAEDFETLWRMDQACFPADQAYSRQELNLYMRQRGAFTLVAELVAADSGPASAGFIVAEAGPRGKGHIVTIDVVQEARRAGVGSRLLEHAERRLHADGCNVVVLETAVDNAAALMFYKRHGYVVEKTVPRYYNGILDAFQMRKDLPARASNG
jgi:ribosomal protein S18 acetylase RimI-like enzyme